MLIYRKRDNQKGRPQVGKQQRHKQPADEGKMLRKRNVQTRHRNLSSKPSNFILFFQIFEKLKKVEIKRTEID